uniref:Uncharacterized protein n=1 Tax=Sinocyclocheilus rhinocerous TaxID=307959 RepID=A0A673FRG7_9TELE
RQEPGRCGSSPAGLRSTHLIRLCLVPQVKQIEKRDSVLTSKQQIDRLLRPGASYFNLNPFEVLQIDPDATDEELKKRFRQVDLHLSVSVKTTRKWYVHVSCCVIHA